MARFYAPFNPSYTNATLIGLGYDKRWIISGDSASSATQRNGLIASRSALSGQMLAQLNAANTFVTTTRGIILPGDGITFSGGNLSWNNVYSGSIDGLKYEVDPSVRIKQPISIADTGIIGAVTPADPGSILQGYYYSASTAVDETIRLLIYSGSASFVLQADGGPYQRPGNYPSKTLHSVYHDYQLTYFAWDDFTPGKPREAATTTPASSNINNTYWYSNSFNITLNWSNSNHEFLNDANAVPIVNLTIVTESISGTTTVTSSGDIVTFAGANQYIWNIPNDFLNNSGVGGTATYQVTASVKLRDHTLFASESISSFGSSSADPKTLILTRLFARNYKYLANPTTRNPFDFTIDCDEFPFTGATYYATKNSVLTATGGETIYTATDSNNPGTAASGYYYDHTVGAVDTIYEVEPFANGNITQGILYSCA
jgi:uncharacterized membrane-anchored protein